MASDSQLDLGREVIWTMHNSVTKLIQKEVEVEVLECFEVILKMYREQCEANGEPAPMTVEFLLDGIKEKRYNLADFCQNILDKKGWRFFTIVGENYGTGGTVDIQDEYIRITTPSILSLERLKDLRHFDAFSEFGQDGHGTDGFVLFRYDLGDDLKRLRII